MQAKDEQLKANCFTVVMGCCTDGKCANKEGTCGCGEYCPCGPKANCNRKDVRVEPDLGRGHGMLIAGALVVLAAAGAATYVYMKNKADKK